MTDGVSWGRYEHSTFSDVTIPLPEKAVGIVVEWELKGDEPCDEEPSSPPP